MSFGLTRRMMVASAAAAAASAAIGRPAWAQSPLGVVATTSMIADAAAVIGADLVDVRGLMGPGVDPHSYRQTRSDIAAMARADLVLYHGLYLEAQMEDFLGKLGQRSTVVPVAEALPHDVLIAHDSYSGKFDPHVWMSPDLWADVATAIGAALADAIPDEATTLRENTARYRDDIGRLSQYARSVLPTVPQGRRVLVTAHDAFKYFGRDFDIEVLGIQGISTESEAGLARVETLVTTLVDRGVKAVFVESSVPDRNVRALVEGARARGHDVVVGGELYSDAMGAPGTYEGTYLGMIDHNVTTIARALGGNAPAGGMDGRLAQS